MNSRDGLVDLTWFWEIHRGSGSNCKNKSGLQSGDLKSRQHGTPQNGEARSPIYRRKRHRFMLTSSTPNDVPKAKVTLLELLGDFHCVAVAT